MGKAVVLRLLRESARQWWWFQTLRKQGRIAEAQKLERESIRNTIRDMRTCKVESFHLRSGGIDFCRPAKPNPLGDTVSMSNVAVGAFAAWIYVYAHNLGAQGDNNAAKRA